MPFELALGPSPGSSLLSIFIEPAPTCRASKALQKIFGKSAKHLDNDTRKISFWRGPSLAEFRDAPISFLRSKNFSKADRSSPMSFSVIVSFKKVLEFSGLARFGTRFDRPPNLE